MDFFMSPENSDFESSPECEFFDVSPPTSPESVVDERPFFHMFNDTKKSRRQPRRHLDQLVRTYVELYTSDEEEDGKPPRRTGRITEQPYRTNDEAGETDCKISSSVEPLLNKYNKSAVREKCQCLVCGTFVNRSYLDRHQKTKKCSTAKTREETSIEPGVENLQSPTPQKSLSLRYSVKIACDRCGKNITAPNLRRHQRSQICKNTGEENLVQNINTEGQNPDPPNMAE